MADVGTTVQWDEVVHLVLILLKDPTSWLSAAQANWAHPIDYNWTLQAATYDLLAQVNSKRKPKPWPRPWDLGNKAKPVPRKDVLDVLKRAKQGDVEWRNKQ